MTREATHGRTLVALLVAIAPAALPGQGAAATITAASCSQANVQSAINSAASGDTVAIPAGSCTWSSAVSWTNKSIAVVGAGKDVTIISCGACFNITSNLSSSAASQWRLSSMTLQGAAPGGMNIQIWDNVGSWHYGWRIDHLKLNYPGSGSGYGIFIGGVTFGLIDHNDWIWGGGLAVIIAAQQSTEYPAGIPNLQGAYSTSLPLDLGTANAVYIEDNTFTGGGAAYDTSSGGGRAVFRYNKLTGCMYYSHWTRSAEVGGVLHEIYNNKFVGNAAYNAYPIRLEAGTGVIFNNTNQMTDNYVLVDERRGFMESSAPLGACDGTKKWDGNAGDVAAPGWPCLGQIGRSPGKTIAQIMAGDKQVSAPLYLWNNGTQDSCSTGGACTNSMTVSVYGGSGAYVKATPHPNGEVDYVLNGSTPKPGYTPFVYPHPLQAGSDTAPPTPPTSLTATAVSSAQINLGWTAATDNVGVALYRVERCAGAACTNFVEVGTATGTSHSDTALSALTTYRYRVRAADAAGNLSGYSNIATATTLALTQDAAVKTDAAVKKDGAIKKDAAVKTDAARDAPAPTQDSLRPEASLVDGVKARELTAGGDPAAARPQDGCGCWLAGGRSSRDALVLAVVGLVLWMARRRRKRLYQQPVRPAP